MLYLYRDPSTSKSTLGELFMDDEFLCDTLEDPVRTGDDGVMQKEEKIYGETAIPAGTYQVVITLSHRFKRLMPLLLNVPFFEGIRIHNGNTPEHTLGCILVGERGSKPDFVGNSIYTFDKIVFPRIEAALQREKLFIEVRNSS